MPSRSDPAVCKRCALVGPTCCTLSLGQEEFCFPLSVAEKDRIQDAAPDQGGFALEPNSTAFVGSVVRLFPGEEELVRALFPEKKFHFRLAVDKDGGCRFLGQQGCVIPVEARPYYCRLFPFWMAGDRVTVFDVPACLARKEGVQQKYMLDLLGVSPAQVRDLMGRLRLVWGLPPRQGMRPVKKGF